MSQDIADVLRVVALALWAVSTVVTVAIVLTYFEARKNNPGSLRLLLSHVALIGTSHIVALTALTFYCYDRIGQGLPASYVLPMTLYANAASCLALGWVLRFQQVRKRARKKGTAHDAAG